MLHLLGFVLALPLPAVGFVLAGFAIRKASPRVSVVLLVAGPLALVLFVVFMATFDPYSAGDNVGISGLLQRALITVVLGGHAMLGLVAARVTAQMPVAAARLA
jgi:hypothetical protein